MEGVSGRCEQESVVPRVAHAHAHVRVVRVVKREQHGEGEVRDGCQRAAHRRHVEHVQLRPVRAERALQRRVEGRAEGAEGPGRRRERR